MAAKTTTCILGDELNAFIKGEIDSGQYATVTEVVRAALWRAKRRKERRAFENRLIDEGLASGLDPRSHEEIWAEIAKKREARKPRAQSAE